ncbi:MAG: hypothetical protein WC291_12405 [Thermodesulfovibrionales bacterium]
MKRFRISIVTMVMMLCAFTGIGYAEELKTAGSGSVDVMSNYVWRGLKLSDSWVIQPSVGITYGSFGANIWVNYDTDIDEVNETDITLSYSRSWDKFTFGAGYIYYALDGFDDTQEVYLSAAYDTILSPKLTLYYDFDEGDGAFIVASIGHTIDLSGMSKGAALSLGASAGFNIENSIMGVDANGEDFTNFYNGELSAALTIPVTDNFSITPKLAYSFPLTDDAKDAIRAISYDNDSSIFYGGINLTLSF